MPCRAPCGPCKVTAFQTPAHSPFFKTLLEVNRMSSESVGANVGANEFPDRVSTAQAENPLLATFRPYIPASVHVRELTVLPLIIGTVLGMIFGASSLWLVLKVGLTVSASIPVAVISISLFRLLGKIGIRDATILENNIVQTAGSAGESIAFG